MAAPIARARLARVALATRFLPASFASYSALSAASKSSGAVV